MKKLYSYSLFALIAIFAIACSGGESTEPAPPAEPTAVEGALVPAVEPTEEIAEPTATQPLPTPAPVEPTAEPTAVVEPAEEPAEVEEPAENDEPAQPLPQTEPTIEGNTWVIYTDFNCNENFANAYSWTFGADNTLLDSRDRERGSWELAGSQLTISFASGQVYQNEVQGGTFTGTRTDKTDPAICTTGYFVDPILNVPVGRTNHSVTQMQQGDLLVLGGNGAWRANESAEIDPIYRSIITPTTTFNPNTGAWTVLDGQVDRLGHQTIGLPNQNYLIVGGVRRNGTAPDWNHLFLSRRGDIANAKALPSGLTNHTLTALQDGRAVVIGGLASPEDASSASSDVFAYDGETSEWEQLASLNSARFNHKTTLLDDGKLLVTGGSVLDAEVYDPATDSWSSVGSPGRSYSNHSATLLNDGKVLLVGGGATPEESAIYADIYDPASNSWSPAADLFSAHGSGHTAVKYNNGVVLVAGGWTLRNGTATASAQVEIYNPELDRWRRGSSMTLPRVGHTATLLSDGSILVIGGYSDPEFPYSSIERYDLKSDTWTIVNP